MSQTNVRQMEQYKDPEKIRWRTANKIYSRGFVDPITNEPRWVPRRARSLYRSLTRQGGAWKTSEFGFRVNFAEMQRMHMRVLQIKLIDIAFAIKFGDDSGIATGADKSIGPALDEYVQAMRNHEYMARFSHQQDDPFVCSSEREQDDYLLRDAFERWKKFAVDLAPAQESSRLNYLAKEAISAGSWKRTKDSQAAQPITSTRGESFRRDIWTRVGAGCVSGLFLIGPMWLLTLKAQEVFLQLGVTSGCVVAFGLLMAWMLPTLEAVFAATLAYAAVLMVFVGVVMQSLQGGGI